MKNQNQYERLISSPTGQNGKSQNGNCQQDSVEYVTYSGETENIYDAGKFQVPESRLSEYNILTDEY